MVSGFGLDSDWAEGLLKTFDWCSALFTLLPSFPSITSALPMSDESSHWRILFFFWPDASPTFSYHTLVVNLGAAVLRFREFISFSGNRIYPEYLIAYRRVGPACKLQSDIAASTGAWSASFGSEDAHQHHLHSHVWTWHFYGFLMFAAFWNSQDKCCLPGTGRQFEELKMNCVRNTSAGCAQTSSFLNDSWFVQTSKAACWVYLPN